MRPAIGLLAVALFLAWGCASTPTPVVFQDGDLTLTVVDTFDWRSTPTSPSVYHDRWGDRLVSTDGSVRVVPGVGMDGSAALRHDYSAEFDVPYDPVAFRDTDVTFGLYLEMPAAPAGARGVTLDVNPGDASVVSFHLKDRSENTFGWHFVSITLEPGEWTRLALPFGLFMPGEDAQPLDPGRPSVLLVSVSFDENADVRAFPRDSTLTGATMVDNVGFYSRDVTPGPGTVAVLDDQEVDAAITAWLYESSAYVDYTKSDEGVLTITPGIDSLAIDTDRRAPGASGFAQRFGLALATNGDFDAYLDEGRQLVVSGRIQIAVPQSGASLVFMVRSDTLDSGNLDLYATGEYHRYVEFPVTAKWAEVTIPIGPEALGGHAYIDYRLPVPPRLMETLRGGGELSVDVAFDEFTVR